ncbi:hypothetical protein FJZ33_00735 [Candidatus Poribacteria bacterium]|nr:hypothetical protein [Candidatus Poribacteria bacterium]
MYDRRRLRISKIALIISGIIHICGFVVIAMIKFNDGAVLNEGKMAVTFVKEQNTKVLKRSFDVRPITSLDQPKSLSK